MNKQQLRTYEAKRLDVSEEDLIYSEKCNNPTKGFKVGIGGTQVAIAGQGYWVTTVAASRQHLIKRGVLASSQ